MAPCKRKEKDMNSKGDIESMMKATIALDNAEQASDLHEACVDFRLRLCTVALCHTCPTDRAAPHPTGSWSPHNAHACMESNNPQRACRLRERLRRP